MYLSTQLVDDILEKEMKAMELVTKAKDALVQFKEKVATVKHSA